MSAADYNRKLYSPPACCILI